MLHALHVRGFNLALTVVVSSTTLLLLLDGDLTLIAASKTLCDIYQINPISVVGPPLIELRSDEWDVPQLTALLEATASGYAAVDG